MIELFLAALSGIGGRLGGLCCSYLSLLGSHFGFLLHLASVLDKLGGRSEFAETVSDHVFGNEYFIKILSRVYGKGVPDEFRWNLTRTRPGLDRTRVRFARADFLH